MSEGFYRLDKIEKMVKTIELIKASDDPNKLIDEFRKHLLKAREKKSVILETPDYVYTIYAEDDAMEKRIEVSYIFMDKMLEVKEMTAKEAVLALIEEFGTALPGYFNVPVINQYERLYETIQKVEKQVRG